MNRRKALYDGKVKTIYEGPEPGTLIQYFKDDARTQLSNETIVAAGKGVLNNRISAYIMTKIEAMGVPTHFIKSLNMREQLVRKVDIIPLEVVVRNVATGSICEKLGLEEKTLFSQPLIEFYYKQEGKEASLVSEQHVFSLMLADPYELEEMVFLALRVNDFLCGLFSAIDLRLIDFKIEFGRLWGESDELYIILADEVSPDNCNLWDIKSNKPMDGNHIEENASDFIENYQAIAKRFGLIPESGIIQNGSVNEQVAEGLAEIENELEKKRRLRSVNKTTKR